MADPALIDANSYMPPASKVSIRRWGRPAMISSNDGCIVAAALARHWAAPWATVFQARRDLERLNVVVRSSNCPTPMSQRLMSLLEQQAEDLKIYSIDEAFAY